MSTSRGEESDRQQSADNVPYEAKKVSLAEAVALVRALTGVGDEPAQEALWRALRDGSIRAEGQRSSSFLIFENDDDGVWQWDTFGTEWWIQRPDFEGSRASLDAGALLKECGRNILLVRADIERTFENRGSMRADGVRPAPKRDLSRGAWLEHARTEMERRFEEKRAAATLAEESRVLSMWLSTEWNTRVSEKTVANQLGTVYKGLRARELRGPRGPRR